MFYNLKPRNAVPYLLTALKFRNMFNKNKVFITIEFADIPGVLDYPKHLPIPNKEDIVHLNGNFGEVEYVKHMTEGNVTDIRIKCCHLFNFDTFVSTKKNNK